MGPVLLNGSRDHVDLRIEAHCISSQHGCSSKSPVRRRLVLGPQPRLQLQQHPPGVGIARLLQGCHELPIRLVTVRLGQVPLQVPALMNRTALRHASRRSVPQLPYS
jgi:hypothetical protein